MIPYATLISLRRGSEVEIDGRTEIVVYAYVDKSDLPNHYPDEPYVVFASGLVLVGDQWMLPENQVRVKHPRMPEVEAWFAAIGLVR